MIMKHRGESKELLLLKSLHTRSGLAEKELNYYANLEKGFEGEKYFDEKWLSHLSDDWIVLNDLLFEINNTIFQIDSAVFSNEAIHLFEVKNYEDDYYIEKDRWYSKSGKEIKNPLHQLDRNETQFRRLLQDFGYNTSKTPITSHVVFVNPDFYLYQTPLKLPLIFPTQINRFMDNLYTKSTTKPRDSVMKLANQLISNQLKESPYTRVPEYKYEELKKGTICASCSSIIHDVPISAKRIVCNKCGCIEEVDSAVLRSVKEFRMLFPERKITTNAIQEWCEIIKSKKTIRRILANNLTPQGRGNSTYYIN